MNSNDYKQVVKQQAVRRNPIKELAQETRLRLANASLNHNQDEQGEFHDVLLESLREAYAIGIEVGRAQGMQEVAEVMVAASKDPTT